MTIDREELEAELRRVYERVDCLATENAGLKRDVDQQMAIANSEANLAEELRAENAALVARVERLEKALDKDATRFEHCAAMISDSFGVSGNKRAERTLKAKHYALEARAALNQTDGGEDIAE